LTNLGSYWYSAVDSDLQNCLGVNLVADFRVEWMEYAQELPVHRGHASRPSFYENKDPSRSGRKWGKTRTLHKKVKSAAPENSTLTE
jgi:hypothetical protein